MAIGVALVVFWILIYYERLGDFELELFIDDLRKTSSRPDIDIPKDDFVAQTISSAVADDFDDSHISQMCDGAPWDKSVVFTCRGIVGGIGTTYSDLEMWH